MFSAVCNDPQSLMQIIYLEDNFRLLIFHIHALMPQSREISVVKQENKESVEAMQQRYFNVVRASLAFADSLKKWKLLLLVEDIPVLKLLKSILKKWLLGMLKKLIVCLYIFRGSNAVF